MSSQQTQITGHSVETPSGRISYATPGTGPVALFVYGVLLNKHLWRHQLAKLSDIRHCIAVDLLAHGETEITPNQDVSVTANAKMVKEVLDALKIDRVDLVGNDSGGGIAQIFAALNPERVRTLTLTNCDVHDNWPPEAFKPFVEMVPRDETTSRPGSRFWNSTTTLVTEERHSADHPMRNGLRD
jgi:pimeloyl-ACP methyl ester carboxylesterase